VAFSDDRRRLKHLLDAGEQPAARAVGGLDEIPHLFEADRRHAGVSRTMPEKRTLANACCSPSPPQAGPH